MNKPKILIVEDETIVALDIKNTIQKLNYEVSDMVTNYADAMKSVQNNEPNIILMDINLANSKDGIEIATDIQKIKDFSIIYLTAFSDDKTIERAVQTNPMGYLLKPFKREELKSTIALVLYKMNYQNVVVVQENFKHIGFDYYFDTNNKHLYYKNLPIKLSIKERTLIKRLIDANGNIVSFKELEYVLWPDYSVADSSLRTLVYRLRNKLEHKLIETVPSFGVKLLTFYL